ncbi:MAG: hypothetical protein VKI42_10270 [Synechococcaceae cyanobacterium]|nr:hypothetical protein [Synechococcaceae cyanobacterium]
MDIDPPPLAVGTLQAANLPRARRPDLLPALEELVARHHPEGLPLAVLLRRSLRLRQLGRGSASRCTDVDRAGDGPGRPAPARRLRRRGRRRCSSAACPCTPW